MKYCVNYAVAANNEPLYDGEVRLSFDEFKNAIGTLNKYSKVVIENIEYDDMDILTKLVRNVRDYVLSIRNFEMANKFIRFGFKVIIDYPCSDWETANEFIKMGVSEIIIDGSLGFDMQSIGRFKEKHNVKIRVCPSKSNSIILKDYPNADSFFIRPEDTDLYEGYIDIFDFTLDTTDRDRQLTLYKIYLKKECIHNLSALISTFNIEDINNKMIQDTFAKTRFNCRHVCATPFGSCHFCERYFHVLATGIEFLKKDL